MQTGHVFLQLVGKDTSKKIYLLVEFRSGDVTNKVKEALEAWKLWKTKGLAEYMGTADYEVVNSKGFSLESAKELFSKGHNNFVHSSDFVKKQMFPGSDAKVTMVRLVPSTSVVKPMTKTECRVCKLPKSTFFLVDNLREFVRDEECSKITGVCSECVHVTKLTVTRPVVCRKCRESVNVLAFYPGAEFGVNNTCFNCFDPKIYTM